MDEGKGRGKETKEGHPGQQELYEQVLRQETQRVGRFREEFCQDIGGSRYPELG